MSEKQTTTSEEYRAPKTALVFSALGISFQIAGAIFVAIVGTSFWIGPIFGVRSLFDTSPLLFISWSFAATVTVIISIWALGLIEAVNPRRVKIGAIVLMLVSIAAVPTVWGFGLGSLSMFLGGFLALARRHLREV